MTRAPCAHPPAISTPTLGGVGAPLGQRQEEEGSTEPSLAGRSWRQGVSDRGGQGAGMASGSRPVLRAEESGEQHRLCQEGGGSRRRARSHGRRGGAWTLVSLASIWEVRGAEPGPRPGPLLSGTHWEGEGPVWDSLGREGPRFGRSRSRPTDESLWSRSHLSASRGSWEERAAQASRGHTQGVTRLLPAHPSPPWATDPRAGRGPSWWSQCEGARGWAGSAQGRGLPEPMGHALLSPPGPVLPWEGSPCPW